jgi:hypothetical protein
VVDLAVDRLVGKLCFGLNMDQLSWLQSWYLDQCDEEWEHSYGVQIGTLDNPGWTLEIDLAGTPLENLLRPRNFEERSERDWIFYKIDECKFIGACGPKNLGELIDVFRDIWQQETPAAP